MAPSIGDTFRVVVKMSDGADDIQNVYHFNLGGSTPPTDAALLTALASTMNTVYDQLDAIMSGDISFDSIQVYNETQDTYVGETGFTTLTTGTAGAGQRLPHQVSPLVLFRTAVLGSLGRKFLPPFYQGMMEGDGTLAASALTAMGNYITQVLNGYTGGTWDVIPGNYRKAIDLFIPYVEGVARDFWATQRRRYKGSGS